MSEPIRRTWRSTKVVRPMVVDLVVVGAGAAGIGAAHAARRRGATVTLIERGPIGGDCTFTGCIPSKTLLQAASRGATFDQAMTSVHQAIATVAASESAVVLRQEGIDVIEGSAQFLDHRTLDVDGRRVHARAIVLATGSSPSLPHIPGLETVPFLTNETIFGLDALPRTLAILGGGPIGVEMAEAFARLGTKVTIVEAAPQLLPREEPMAARVIADAFSALGITQLVSSPVTGVTRASSGDGVELTLEGGATLQADRLLVAVGRQPITKGLGLERAGVEVNDRGFIKVDSRLRTTAAGILAAGDVASPLQFTHVAYQTGRIAATNALARIPLHRFRTATIPWVTFTSLEVARVGMTEAESVTRGGRVVFVPMSQVDRAITSGHTDGFVKIVVGPRPLLRNLAGGRILGATIVAPRAGEMLHEIVLAMQVGMFPARLAQSVHAYPTWSMAIQQAAAQLFGEFGGRRVRPASANPGDSGDSLA